MKEFCAGPSKATLPIRHPHPTVQLRDVIADLVESAGVHEVSESSCSAEDDEWGVLKLERRDVRVVLKPKENKALPRQVQAATANLKLRRSGHAHYQEAAGVTRLVGATTFDCR